MLDRLLYLFPPKHVLTIIALWYAITFITYVEENVLFTEKDFENIDLVLR